MSLSSNKKEAIKILDKLSKDFKITKKITLCITSDLAEDETETEYRHGTSYSEYFFENGKFWTTYSCVWNKMIRERDELQEKNHPMAISPEIILDRVSFKQFNLGFYGSNTPCVKIKNHNDWLEKATAIDTFIRSNI